MRDRKAHAFIGEYCELACKGNREAETLEKFSDNEENASHSSVYPSIDPLNTSMS
jgi:hypothetical protein